MKFLQVDPEAIEAQGVLSARGGVIGPLIAAFLATNFFMAEIDCAEIGRKPASVSASIAAYSKNHILPIRPVLRQPKLYLQRRDVDKDGKAITDWKDELLQMHVDPDAPVVPTIQFESVALKAQQPKK